MAVVALRDICIRRISSAAIIRVIFSMGGGMTAVVLPIMMEANHAGEQVALEFYISVFVTFSAILWLSCD